MDWPSEICDNCKCSSYSMAINKICPHCYPDYVFERILNKINDQAQNIECFVLDNCKKYNINLDEINNRLIVAAAFYENKNTKESLSDLIKKLNRFL